MKIISKTLLVVALVAQGLVLMGCDSETHPDPHLVQSANAQRQAQNPGQPGQQPPTGQTK